MNTWFEVKVKYEKIDETGKEKMVTELYLMDAVSFTDCESRMHKELEPYITGEFNITSERIANYSELIPNETGNTWFRCKVAFIAIDEEKGIEKKTNVYILVQADNVKESYDRINDALKDTVSDFEIPAIQVTKIMDVFTYQKSPVVDD